ncbi:MAG: YybH family protein [Myxococcaceae bacterium]
MKVSITSAMLGVVLFACSHGSPEVSTTPSPDVVKAAIAANNQAFARAIIAKDATALANMFTEDAVFVAPSGGFVRGRAALAPFWAERLKKAAFLDGGITTESLDVRGDIAIEASSIAWTIQAGDAAPVRRTGRALTVWHHDPDGQWRMMADYPAYDPPT